MKKQKASRAKPAPEPKKKEYKGDSHIPYTPATPLLLRLKNVVNSETFVFIPPHPQGFLFQNSGTCYDPAYLRIVTEFSSDFQVLLRELSDHTVSRIDVKISNERIVREETSYKPFLIDDAYFDKWSQVTCADTACFLSHDAFQRLKHQNNDSVNMHAVFEDLKDSGTKLSFLISRMLRTVVTLFDASDAINNSIDVLNKMEEHGAGNPAAYFAPRAAFAEVARLLSANSQDRVVRHGDTYTTTHSLASYCAEVRSLAMDKAVLHEHNGIWHWVSRKTSWRPMTAELQEKFPTALCDPKVVVGLYVNYIEQLNETLVTLDQVYQELMKLLLHRVLVFGVKMFGASHKYNVGFTTLTSLLKQIITVIDKYAQSQESGEVEDLEDSKDIAVPKQAIADQREKVAGLKKYIEQLYADRRSVAQCDLRLDVFDQALKVVSKSTLVSQIETDPSSDFLTNKYVELRERTSNAMRDLADAFYVYSGDNGTPDFSMLKQLRAQRPVQHRDFFDLVSKRLQECFPASVSIHTVMSGARENGFFRTGKPQKVRKGWYYFNPAKPDIVMSMEDFDDYIGFLYFLQHVTETRITIERYKGEHVIALMLHGFGFYIDHGHKNSIKRVVVVGKNQKIVLDIPSGYAMFQTPPNKELLRNVKYVFGVACAREMTGTDNKPPSLASYWPTTDSGPLYDVPRYSKAGAVYEHELPEILHADQVVQVLTLVDAAVRNTRMESPVGILYPILSGDRFFSTSTRHAVLNDIWKVLGMCMAVAQKPRFSDLQKLINEDTVKYVLDLYSRKNAMLGDGQEQAEQEAEAREVRNEQEEEEEEEGNDDDDEHKDSSSDDDDNDVDGCNDLVSDFARVLDEMEVAADIPDEDAHNTALMDTSANALDEADGSPDEAEDADPQRTPTDVYIATVHDALGSVEKLLKLIASNGRQFRRRLAFLREQDDNPDLDLLRERKTESATARTDLETAFTQLRQVLVVSLNNLSNSMPRDVEDMSFPVLDKYLNGTMFTGPLRLCHKLLHFMSSGIHTVFGSEMTVENTLSAQQVQLIQAEIRLISKTMDTIRRKWHLHDFSRNYYTHTTVHNEASTFSLLVNACTESEHQLINTIQELFESLHFIDLLSEDPKSIVTRSETALQNQAFDSKSGYFDNIILHYTMIYSLGKFDQTKVGSQLGIDTFRDQLISSMNTIFKFYKPPDSVDGIPQFCVQLSYELAFRSLLQTNTHSVASCYIAKLAHQLFKFGIEVQQVERKEKRIHDESRSVSVFNSDRMHPLEKNRFLSMMTFFDEIIEPRDCDNSRDPRQCGILYRAELKSKETPEIGQLKSGTSVSIKARLVDEHGNATESALTGKKTQTSFVKRKTATSAQWDKLLSLTLLELLDDAEYGPLHFSIFLICAKIPVSVDTLVPALLVNVLYCFGEQITQQTTNTKAKRIYSIVSSGIDFYISSFSSSYQIQFAHSARRLDKIRMCQLFILRRFVTNLCSANENITVTQYSAYVKNLAEAKKMEALLHDWIPEDIRERLSNVNTATSATTLLENPDDDGNEDNNTQSVEDQVGDIIAVALQEELEQRRDILDLWCQRIQTGAVFAKNTRRGGTQTVFVAPDGLEDSEPELDLQEEEEEKEDEEEEESVGHRTKNTLADPGLVARSSTKALNALRKMKFHQSLFGKRYQTLTSLVQVRVLTSESTAANDDDDFELEVQKETQSENNTSKAVQLVALSVYNFFMRSRVFCRFTLKVLPQNTMTPVVKQAMTVLGQFLVEWGMISTEFNSDDAQNEDSDFVNAVSSEDEPSEFLDSDDDSEIDLDLDALSTAAREALRSETSELKPEKTGAASMENLDESYSDDLPDLVPDESETASLQENANKQADEEQEEEDDEEPLDASLFEVGKAREGADSDADVDDDDDNDDDDDDDDGKLMESSGVDGDSSDVFAAFAKDSAQGNQQDTRANKVTAHINNYQQFTREVVIAQRQMNFITDTIENDNVVYTFITGHANLSSVGTSSSS